MRKLVLVLVGAVIVVGAATLIPTRAECGPGGCPVGEKCSGDWGCNSYTCNLKCVSVKRYSMDGRCVIAAE